MRGLLATTRAAFAEARANPGAFWSQLAAMFLNDIVWVAFWVLYFRRVGSVRGWDQPRVLLLLAIITTGAGLVLGLLSNTRRIGQLVLDGGIDATLALPVPPLAHVLVRRVDAVNLGDAAFGVLLFALAGNPTLERTALFVLASLASAVVFAGFLVIVNSLTFFVGRTEPGDLGFHAIILLASYPVDIFAGAIKVLLYTAVPAAFVTALPTRLVDDFDGATAAVLAVVSVGFALGAWATFTSGLRRYRSSAVWTRA